MRSSNSRYIIAYVKKKSGVLREKCKEYYKTFVKNERARVNT